MSTGCEDYVVLFKAVSERENGDDDTYFKKFLSAGFQVILIPVLDFEFVNLQELLIKLKNPDNYAGIIFTSPRCVTGVQLSLGNDTSFLEKWKNHKHFVVGEKTAELIGNLKLVASGKEAGNAEKLAKVISSGKYKKPFLYPKGSLTKNNFKSELKESNIVVDDIVIYKTKPHHDLERSLSNVKFLLPGRTVYFVYFSPSGINFTLPLLRKLQFDLNQVKFIAIGPTTEGALQENGFKVAATSSKPDPQSLLDAVLSA